jgi:hypothetical protein
MNLFLNISAIVACGIAISGIFVASRIMRRSAIEEQANAELEAAAHRFGQFDRANEERMREISKHGNA